MNVTLNPQYNITICNRSNIKVRDELNILGLVCVKTVTKRNYCNMYRVMSVILHHVMELTIYYVNDVS